MRARSRGVQRPSYADYVALLEEKGAGKTGRWPRPWPACGKKCRRQVPQVWPNTPGPPCAMVLTAASRSPWCAGLFGHHARNALLARYAGHQHRGARTARLDRACIAVRPRE